jgi:lipopolysaccharide biosynthesis protein
LPQYHPIPENDEWWGPGFTEWTNTAKARPLFRGHVQPNLPGDLGFYDLRLPETREAQARLARDAGIEAFCYYHYWFGNGRRLLERPFREVVESGEPDFPFCVCWANQTWTGIWFGEPNRVLIHQTYPGDDDHRRHFDALLPAFVDRRYVRVDGKPLFMIYGPRELPEPKRTVELWKRLAEESGLEGLHIVAIHGRPDWDHRPLGFDGRVWQRLAPLRAPWIPWTQPIEKMRNYIDRKLERPTVVPYQRAIDMILPPTPIRRDDYPCVVPNWDNTPRSGSNGLVFQGSTPELFRLHLRRALELKKTEPEDHRIVIIKSWNEWAEGNYLEPDRRFGHAYLDVVRDEVARVTAPMATSVK